MTAASKKTLVVRNGTLIDGSGKPPARNDAIVIEGNRIKSVGALPPDVQLEDRRNVEVIDAGGQWIMPGLIDAHCHMSYGYPLIKGEGKGKGTTRPEFSTLKSARSAQKVLRSGVTSISVPGGTWFTDVGVRDAIKLGLMEGPRMFVAGRMIITYGCIEDDEPSWEGTPDHSIGKLCNTADEMVTEVRRQQQARRQFHQDGGQPLAANSQMLAQRGDRRRGRRGAPAQPARRDPFARRGLDARRRRSRRRLDHARRSRHRPRPRSGGQGRHADPADRDLPRPVVVELGSKVGAEQVQLDINRMKRHFDLLCELMHKARKLGIKLLVGTDTGNNTFTRHGELHAKELEIFVKYGGYTPMEAIVAATRDNAFAVGLEGQVGEIAPGKLADLIVLNKDPHRRHHRAAGRQAPVVGDQGRQDRRPRAARRDADVPAGGGITSSTGKRCIESLPDLAPQVGFVRRARPISWPRCREGRMTEIARLRVEIDEVDAGGDPPRRGAARRSGSTICISCCRSRSAGRTAIRSSSASATRPGAWSIATIRSDPAAGGDGDAGRPVGARQHVPLRLRVTARTGSTRWRSRARSPAAPGVDLSAAGQRRGPLSRRPTSAARPATRRFCRRSPIPSTCTTRA